MVKYVVSSDLSDKQGQKMCGRRRNKGTACDGKRSQGLLQLPDRPFHCPCHHFHTRHSCHFSLTPPPRTGFMTQRKPVS